MRPSEVPGLQTAVPSRKQLHGGMGPLSLNLAIIYATNRTWAFGTMVHPPYNLERHGPSAPIVGTACCPRRNPHWPCRNPGYCMPPRLTPGPSVPDRRLRLLFRYDKRHPLLSRPEYFRGPSPPAPRKPIRSCPRRGDWPSAYGFRHGQERLGRPAVGRSKAPSLSNHSLTLGPPIVPSAMRFPPHPNWKHNLPGTEHLAASHGFCALSAAKRIRIQPPARSIRRVV